MKPIGDSMNLSVPFRNVKVINPLKPVFAVCVRIKNRNMLLASNNFRLIKKRLKKVDYGCPFVAKFNNCNF